jgi:outer membrane protein assembly factor BamB
VVSKFGSEIVGVSRTREKPWAAPGSPSLPGALPVVARTAAGEVVVTPDAAGGLSGLDATTGQTLWGPVAKAKFAFGGPTALPDGTVAWGGGGVSVVDPETGEVLRRNQDVSSLTTLAADGGLLFGIFAAGNNAALGAVDQATLRPVWAKRFDSAKILGVIPVTPGAGDGVVAVVDSGDVLRVLDGRTGDERWHLRLRLAPNSPPVVWDGRVWVEEPGLPEDLSQHEHRVTVLDAETGAMEASWEIPGAIFFSDMFRRSGDRMLVTVPSGIVAARPEER